MNEKISKAARLDPKIVHALETIAKRTTLTISAVIDALLRHVLFGVADGAVITVLDALDLSKKLHQDLEILRRLEAVEADIAALKLASSPSRVTGDCEP